jgi:hypothetical protein
MYILYVVSAAKPRGSPYINELYNMCYITAISCKRCRSSTMEKLHPCDEGRTGLICLDTNALLNDTEITRINNKGNVALDLLDCVQVRHSDGYCWDCDRILAEKQRREESARGRQPPAPETRYLGYY